MGYLLNFRPKVCNSKIQNANLTLRTRNQFCTTEKPCNHRSLTGEYNSDRKIMTDRWMVELAGLTDWLPGQLSLLISRPTLYPAGLGLQSTAGQQQSSFYSSNLNMETRHGHIHNLTTISPASYSTTTHRHDDKYHWKLSSSHLIMNPFRDGRFDN